ncbi:hypothetical protein NQ176_g6115 [Zarea fungicola]|uniref:Uncharacterized protein n=1 Tax=Zarea fungicola TaxID=93591 RepID=A0ACC1N637_9HYPO|nr:hypothetical protein NQ176_g6115 [Lecanicillium fungicola]
MGRQNSIELPTEQHVEVEKLADAQGASVQERDLGFFQAIKLYPKAVFWSLVMSTVVIMEGYDTVLVGTFYAQPAFKKAYGVKGKTGQYQIPAQWQVGLSNGSAVGQLLGILLAGYTSERFGFRKSMIGGLVLITAFIFITFFAPNLIVLEVGQALFGVPLGMFQVTTVIYALEISPLCLRPYLTNYVNFCWSFGKIIGAGVARGTLSMENEWAYRIPFGIQWVWPAMLIPLIYFAPESPWWLVRQGNPTAARNVVQKLISRTDPNFDIDKNVTLMIVTTEHERTINSETSYRACFQSANLRRTLIVVGIYCIQVLNGNSLRGYSTYFLQQAGLPTTQAFNMTIANLAVAIVGSFCSWAFLPLFGRRTFYFWNLVLMFVIMMLIGGLGIPSTPPKPTYAWGVGSLLLISSFVYSSSIGPLTNTLCSEIPSSLLRSKSIALARWTYAVATIVAGVFTPYQLNPTAWNWSAKTGFFWAGGCLISIVFTYYCVPEPKNRTTAEMDILFEKGVSARHFSKTHVDLLKDIYGDEKANGV